MYPSQPPLLIPSNKKKLKKLDLAAFIGCGKVLRITARSKNEERKRERKGRE